MILKKKLLALAFTAMAILAMPSCKTPKDITYMQGFEQGDVQAVRAQTRITVQPDDKLSILVTCKDPKLAEMFNLAIPQYRVGYTGRSFTNTDYTAAYTVTPDGNINYPVLGKLHVAGLSRAQVADLIRNKIEQQELLKDPTVIVEFMNATISIIGDVASPGEYNIDRDNLTILQALAKARDLQITGMRKNVLVVREENGKDVAYRLDLTDTKSLMESPAYHLRQNDVVYVEPNNMKKRASTSSGSTVATPTFWISIASLLTTAAAVFIK